MESWMNYGINFSKKLRSGTDSQIKSIHVFTVRRSQVSKILIRVSVVLYAVYVHATHQNVEKRRHRSPENE